LTEAFLYIAEYLIAIRHIHQMLVITVENSFTISLVQEKGSFSILIFSWAISCRIHALSMLVFSGLPVKAKASETSKNQ
jgi:hypothetical protein